MLYSWSFFCICWTNKTTPGEKNSDSLPLGYYQYIGPRVFPYMVLIWSLHSVFRHSCFRYLTHSRDLWLTDQCVGFHNVSVIVCRGWCYSMALLVWILAWPLSVQRTQSSQTEAKVCAGLAWITCFSFNDIKKDRGQTETLTPNEDFQRVFTMVCPSCYADAYLSALLGTWHHSSPACPPHIRANLKRSQHPRLANVLIKLWMHAKQSVRQMTPSPVSLRLASNSMHTQTHCTGWVWYLIRPESWPYWVSWLRPAVTLADWLCEVPKLADCSASRSRTHKPTLFAIHFQSLT